MSVSAPVEETRPSPVPGTPKPRHWWLTRSRQVTLGAVLIGLFSGLAALELERLDRVRRNNWTENLSRVAYDAAQRYRAPDARKMLVQEKRVVLVLIDNQTLEELGARATADMPRGLHAQLVDRLNELGARVIAFDMVFNPSTGDDRELAEAMRRHRKVVVGAEMSRAFDTTGGGQAANVQRNPTYTVPEIRDAGSWGWVNVPVDAIDDAVRQFWWYDIGIDPDTTEDMKVPTLAVAAAALYLGQDPVASVRSVDGGKFCGRSIATVKGSGEWDGLQYSPINFVGGREAFPTFKYQEVLGLTGADGQARRDFPEIRDALVIVGDASGVSQDVHKTPLFTERIQSNQMPGSALQANIAHTVLDGKFIRTASERSELWLLFIACVWTALLTRYLNPFISLASMVGVLAAIISFGWMALDQWLYWLDPVRACLGVIVTYGLVMAFIQLTERREQRALTGVFGSLVGPSVMQELLREDKPPVLGGEMRSISLLFSDLQGFTTISETMPAPQLVGMLNEYFDVMLSIIDKYGGTLDKLMGDGIMAYFGAPRPYPDHAQRAVACALEMQEAMEKFREEEREKGLPPLFMRIGLHSGEAVVGLIGMKGRQNYSVTGDVVNVAARLEGLNKEFGTQILMSEDTCKAAEPSEPTVFRGETSVKGRVRPIPVYSIGPPQPAE